MIVQELIDALNKVENKDYQVIVETFNEKEDFIVVGITLVTEDLKQKVVILDYKEGKLT